MPFYSASAIPAEANAGAHCEMTSVLRLNGREEFFCEPVTFCKTMYLKEKQQKIMKSKYSILALILLFVALCLNVFAQKTYPFEVVKSGTGKRNVIFIPGFACSGKVWDETKAVYEKDHTCYVLTMAGFAGSKTVAGSSFKSWEQGIADYIKDNRIEKPVVIGHSMGGGLAMALAADYPALIERIVVVDALPCLSALMDPAFKPSENNDCRTQMSMILGVSDQDFYKMQMTSAASLSSDSTRHESIANWSLQSDRTTFVNMFCDFSNTDLRQKISTVQCPALILLEPSFKSVESAMNEQYSALKGARLKYATKGLHFIMFDDKEWFLEQCVKFTGAVK